MEHWSDQLSKGPTGRSVGALSDFTKIFFSFCFSFSFSEFFPRNRWGRRKNRKIIPGTIYLIFPRPLLRLTLACFQKNVQLERINLPSPIDFAIGEFVRRNMREIATIHKGQRLLDGSLKTRTARPLNGLEVREAVETHLLTLTDRLLGNVGLLSDQVIKLSEELKETVRTVLSRQFRLSKVHLTYPKVGWNIKTRVEQLPDHSYAVNAEVELDLERNVRLNLQFGESGRGIVIASLEEEKIPTDTPDTDRDAFGMPIEAEFIKPDGTTGKVDVRELRGERRVARTIDVGSGADGRVPREVPAEIETPTGTVIGTKEILMTGGEGGQEVVLPQDLPEISLDDVVATPPEPPKEPLRAPLLPKGVGQFGRPNAKFKGK